MKVLIIVFSCCFILAVNNSFAKTGGDNRVSSILVRYTPKLNANIQLQVEHASLKAVLDELSRVTEATIHYSVLTDMFITATCVADNLKAVLKCLLGKSQNIAYQYTQKKGQVGIPKDVWILGSSLAELTLLEDRDGVSCKGGVTGFTTVPMPKDTKQADEELVAQLMLKLESTDPKQRADAIADLATKTVKDNVLVDNILLASMNDQSARVREQVLFAWVYRKGADASVELQRALLDDVMSVRMKVVDLTENVALLRIATSDEDELVRDFAHMKLEAREQKAK